MVIAIQCIFVLLKVSTKLTIVNKEKVNIEGGVLEDESKPDPQVCLLQRRVSVVPDRVQDRPPGSAFLLMSRLLFWVPMLQGLEQARQGSHSPHWQFLGLWVVVWVFRGTRSGSSFDLLLGVWDNWLGFWLTLFRLKGLKRPMPGLFLNLGLFLGCLSSADSGAAVEVFCGWCREVEKRTADS